MSAGSSASNLGYSEFIPNSNIDPNYVNVSSNNYSAGFTSTQIPTAKPATLCMKGGTNKSNKKSMKKIKRKIKNIIKKYNTMSNKNMKKKIKTLRKKIRKSLKSKRHHSRIRFHNISRHFGRHFGRQYAGKMRGGYSQHGNNVPATASYSVAGVNLPSNLSALANPPPVTSLSGNCVDNYNRMTNTGFPSK